MEGIAWIFIVLFGIAIGVIGVIFLVVPLFKGIAFVLTGAGRGVVWFFTHIISFIFGMGRDIVRAFGGCITTLVLVPIVLGNIVIGRWSASGHYGRVLQDEIKGVGHCFYRVIIGHPARFLLLGGLTEGIEKRIPQAVAHAPGADKPSSKTGQFDGYKVLGSLPGGGSGGRLYVAEPDERKRAVFARAGQPDVKQVVIKSFSLDDGSSLPQIIRESRALEAAKKLQLILDHELNDARFYYVMEFIPGDSLTIVTKRLHAEAGPDGLREKQLAPAMTMIADLLTELTRYHHGGLWHKDVKPDNIIINQGRAHLVDLGLITPLRSAMTLTTHGTEYFRDPELVRMALRGAKVNEVDGVKFDLYGVGAVLYSIIENSFPAHGGLSQITRSCPEALRWVVRRAMTDLSNRYATASEMLADLRSVLACPEPFMMKPVELPSMSGRAPVEMPFTPDAEPVVIAAAASPRVEYGPPPIPPIPSPAPGSGARGKPRIGVTDWWTGKYAARPDGRPEGAMDGFDQNRVAADASRVAREAIDGVKIGFGHAKRALDELVRGRTPGAPGARPPMPAGPGRTAAEQLSAAHDRVRRAQERIGKRMHGGAYRTSFDRGFSTNPNKGVSFAVFALAAGLVFVGFVSVNQMKKNTRATEARASAARNIFPVTTDDGELRIALAPREAELTRPGRSNFKQIARDIAESYTPSGSDQRSPDEQLAELNDVGEKVAVFFDSVRARSGLSRRPVKIIEPATPVSVPEGSLAVADAAHDSAHSVGATRGVVLVLNMLPGDVEEREQNRIGALLRRLKSRGFDVRDESTSSDPEVFAAARRVVELSEPGDAAAVERIRAWLDEGASGVDSMLWIGLGKNENEVATRLVSREAFDENAVRDALRTK